MGMKRRPWTRTAEGLVPTDESKSTTAGYLSNLASRSLTSKELQGAVFVPSSEAKELGMTTRRRRITIIIEDVES